jgi:hypothetical protein
MMATIATPFGSKLNTKLAKSNVPQRAYSETPTID